MLSPSKKRRHDDDPNQVQVQLYDDPQISLVKSLSANCESRTRTSQHESTNLLSAINNNERFIFPTSARGAASLLNMPRKMIPLPVNKRFRLVNDNDGHLHSHNSYCHAHPESRRYTIATAHQTRHKSQNRAIKLAIPLKPLPHLPPETHQEIRPGLLRRLLRLRTAVLFRVPTRVPGLARILRRRR